MSKEYFAGARMALDLARQCRRSAEDFDDAWRAFMLAEDKRHRDRARWYLRQARSAEQFHRQHQEQAA